MLLVSKAYAALLTNQVGALTRSSVGVGPFVYFQRFRLFASFFFQLSLAFCYISLFRAVSNWVSKVMLYCFGFALLRCVIGPENSCHNLNQSNVKLKPNTTWSLAFSRALRRLAVCWLDEFSLANNHGNLFSDWKLWLPWFWFFDTELRSARWLAVVINLDLIVGHLVEMRFLTIHCFISVCKYYIKLIRQCQNYKQVNKLFIPTFAVCLEWELVLHLVGGWSSFSISWFYLLVFSVFDVRMCLKIVFGLNTYSVTKDLD